MRGYSHGRPVFLPPPEIARNHPIPDLLDKRLVFVTGKGGVGKTDLTVNLSCQLASLGMRMLIIDLDPQANATDYLVSTGSPAGRNGAGVRGSTATARAGHQGRRA